MEESTVFKPAQSVMSILLFQGDRMWSFGVGLFLVNIASQNLQLPAVYGLASCLTIFFLGATVGNWVDHTPRLKGRLYFVGWVVAIGTGLYLFDGQVGSLQS